MVTKKVKKLPKKKIKQEISKKSLKKVKRKIRTKRIAGLLLTALIIVLLFSAGMLFYINSNHVTSSQNRIVSAFISLNGHFIKPQPLQEEVAVVNGKPIYASEFNDVYNRLPPQYRAGTPEQQRELKLNLLQQMIQEELLLQQADKKGMEVKDVEVTALIDNLLAQSGVSRDDFEAQLQEQNLTLDEIREFYSKQMLITKLLNTTVLNDIEVTPQEILLYYQNNTEQFVDPERLNASHILVCYTGTLRCEKNRSKEDALRRIEEVQEIVNVTNFQETAKMYSDEPIANETGGSLGWIAENAPFDPDFLEAAFALEEGEISKPTKTQFGYHLILIHEKKERDIVSLQDVSDQIEQILLIQKRQKKFDAYMKNLQEEATIVNFFNQTLP